MCRHVDLVWIDVSEECIVSIFREEKSASEEPASAGGCSLWYVPPKRPFTQDLHGAITQKTAFFIVTAVKTSHTTTNLFMKMQSYIISWNEIIKISSRKSKQQDRLASPRVRLVSRLLPVLWKNKCSPREHHVRMYLGSVLIIFRMPWSIFMKLRTFITAPEPIVAAFFINPSHQSVCISSLVARQRLGKNVSWIGILSSSGSCGHNEHLGSTKPWKFSWPSE
jgi:hypothetical protein